MFAFQKNYTASFPVSAVKFLLKMALCLLKRPKCPFLLMFYIILALLNQCGLGMAQLLDVSFNPSFIRDLKTGEARNVTIRLGKLRYIRYLFCDIIMFDTLAYDISKMERKQFNVKLLAEMQDDKVAQIVDLTQDNFTLKFNRSIPGESENEEAELLKNEIGNVTYFDSMLTIKGICHLCHSVITVTP